MYMNPLVVAVMAVVAVVVCVVIKKHK